MHCCQLFLDSDPENWNIETFKKVLRDNPKGQLSDSHKLVPIIIWIKLVYQQVWVVRNGAQTGEIPGNFAETVSNLK